MVHHTSAPGRPDAGDADPAELDSDAYLERIGVDPDTVESADLATLERLQAAHVRAVPFENLAIVGGPADWSGDEGDLPRGEGVVLSTPHLYRKVVGRGLGGYCFELNGLFHWLLAEVGYDVDRVAARVVSGGDATPPANHHANVVELDRRYVVDVGIGIPTMRRPTPLDGTARTDEVGVEWRVVASDRPDEAYRTEVRSTWTDGEWSTRYVFGDVPRDLSYFAATNDYLQTAPESPFTGHPVVTVATDEGHLKLSDETLTETVGGEERERTVPPEEFWPTVEREFGIRYDR